MSTTSSVEEIVDSIEYGEVPSEFVVIMDTRAWKNKYRIEINGIEGALWVTDDPKLAMAVWQELNNRVRLARALARLITR